MSADIELKWEWPANRKPEEKILIKINNIKEQSSGFFGIKKSPSLTSNLPDPVVISGTVLDTDKTIQGKKVSFVLPKLEAVLLEVNSYAVLGIIETNTCICIIPAESPNIDLTTVSCP